MDFNLEEFENKILYSIKAYEMLDSRENVVLAVSGGADSMALLYFFIKNMKDSVENIIVAHVNHCLRGTESDFDENFVKNYCIKHSLNFKCLKVDVRKQARENGNGIEECARNIRYDFFKKLSMEYNAKIATAHTLSDNSETVLLNLVRGTGLCGLCGIPPKRDNIIRPLLFVKRNEIEKYCEICGIKYVTDSTNFKRDYARNKIRLDVIPILKEINPSFEDVIQREVSIFSRDEQCLNKLSTDELLRSRVSANAYDLSILMKLNESIITRCIRLAIGKVINTNVSSRHVNLVLNCMKNGKGCVNITDSITACVRNEKLEIINKEIILNNINDIQIPFKEGEIFLNDNKRIIVEILDIKEYYIKLKFNNLLFFNALDYDIISKNSLFRYRRSGDKFCKQGRGVTKTIKKFFNEEKIPIDVRNNIIMLANNNEILWIHRFGVSEKAKVKDSTKKVVIIYLKES